MGRVVKSENDGRVVRSVTVRVVRSESDYLF